MLSQVKKVNGLPTLFVNGEAVPEMAYITYNTKNNRYADFSSAGVKLYSVNLNFYEMPINEYAPVLIFQKGIFEKGELVFSVVEENFDEILSVCPDALIFPRVNVNLSYKWEKEHPDELCSEGMHGRSRVSFASDLWAQEVKTKLAELINRIENSRFSDNVIGYQIAGGNTEEWLPFENYGFYGKRAKEKFLKLCEKNNLKKNEENYFRFASELTAQRIIEFATVAKEAVNDRKIIGAFYGYTIGCPHRVNLHLALNKILESDRIDFLCSPLIYVYGRAAGLDPYPMIPIDSLRLHGKLYFSENDIRTHLSRPPSPHPNYSTKIWFGPQRQTSLEQIKLNFCRAFTHGHGMWWFDMWGGWYSDKEFMQTFSKLYEICADGMETKHSQVAVFTDENCYFGLKGHGNKIWDVCNSIGLLGVMYDIFLASDFDKVFADYKACVFVEPIKTDLMTDCINRAEESNIAVKVITDDNEVTPENLRGFFKSVGLNVPIDRNAVVYESENYIVFYAHEKGEYDLSLDGRKTFTDLFTGEEITFPYTVTKTTCRLFRK
jgi:beta-galactosidase